MSERKTLNLRGDDRKRWDRLKMKRINDSGNPDFNDIDLLREMMDDYEAKLESQETEATNEDTVEEGEQQ